MAVDEEQSHAFFSAWAVQEVVSVCWMRCKGVSQVVLALALLAWAVCLCECVCCVTCEGVLQVVLALALLA
jgi:hypothetical protein